MERMGTGDALQGQDQDQKLRNHLLYTAIYGLGCVEKRFKVVEIDFRGYHRVLLIRSL